MLFHSLIFAQLEAFFTQRLEELQTGKGRSSDADALLSSTQLQFAPALVLAFYYIIETHACTQTYTHMHIQLFLKLCFLLIFFIAENIGRVAIKEPLFEHVLQQTELCPRAIDLLTLVLTQVATRKDEWLRFVFFIIT